jgi:hypothetical protein
MDPSPRGSGGQSLQLTPPAGDGDPPSDDLPEPEPWEPSRRGLDWPDDGLLLGLDGRLEPCVPGMPDGADGGMPLGRPGVGSPLLGPEPPLWDIQPASPVSTTIAATARRRGGKCGVLIV